MCGLWQAADIVAQWQMWRRHGSDKGAVASQLLLRSLACRILLFTVFVLSLHSRERLQSDCCARLHRLGLPGGPSPHCQSTLSGLHSAAWMNFRPSTLSGVSETTVSHSAHTYPCR